MDYQIVGGLSNSGWIIYLKSAGYIFGFDSSDFDLCLGSYFVENLGYLVYLVSSNRGFSLFPFVVGHTSPIYLVGCVWKSSEVKERLLPFRSGIFHSPYL